LTELASGCAIPFPEEAALAHRSDKHHEEGLNVLVGTLVVVVVALALVSLSGGFGHTRRISEDAQPVWPAGAFK
jgi:hypothetical protein